MDIHTLVDNIGDMSFSHIEKKRKRETTEDENKYAKAMRMFVEEEEELQKSHIFINALSPRAAAKYVEKCNRSINGI